MTTNGSNNYVTVKKDFGSPKFTSPAEEDRQHVINQMLKRIPLKDDSSWIYSNQVGLEEDGIPQLNAYADDDTDSKDSSAPVTESSPPTFAVRSLNTNTGPVSNSQKISTPQANFPSPTFVARRVIVNEETIPSSRVCNGSTSPVNPMNLSKGSMEVVAASKLIMNSSPKFYNDQEKSELLPFGDDSGELSDIKTGNRNDEIPGSVDQRNVIVIKKEIHNVLMAKVDPELFQAPERECTFCGMALEDIKIIIEHLNICSHPSCFKCGKCSAPLGDLEAGDNLWIHSRIVHCEECYDKLLED